MRRNKVRAAIVAIVVVMTASGVQAQGDDPRARAAEQAAREEAMRAAAAAELAARDAAIIGAAQGQWAELIGIRIRKFWAQPPGVPEGLSAIVQLEVEPDGRVKSASVAQGSGNDSFDRSMLYAATKASPLPPPPDPRAFNPVIKIRMCSSSRC